MEYACVSHKNCLQQMFDKYGNGECLFGLAVTCVCGEQTWYFYQFDVQRFTLRDF